jgi:hypothetical protein
MYIHTYIHAKCTTQSQNFTQLAPGTCEVKSACSKKRLAQNFTLPALWGPVRGAFYYTRFSCIQDRSPILLLTLPLILLQSAALWDLCEVHRFLLALTRPSYC